MEVEIRECLVDDANAIYRLNCDEMGYSYPLDATKENLSKLINSNNDKIFVAVADNLVVGYIHANDYDLIYTPHMKNIMGFAVKSEYKRNGIGKALISEVEKWAKNTNACGIRLVSGSERTGAHQFYEYCGYCKGKQQINFKKKFSE